MRLKAFLVPIRTVLPHGTVTLFGPISQYGLGSNVQTDPRIASKDPEGKPRGYALRLIEPCSLADTRGITVVLDSCP